MALIFEAVCGLHPNRETWVRGPRNAEQSGFKLRNKHRPQASKTF
jgi:hypothetical protein